MKKYKFEVTLGYELEAVDEIDCVNQLADLIKKDYIYLIDEGDITEISDK